MTLLDSIAAIPGALAHLVSGLLRGSRRGLSVVIVGLFIVTAIPIFLVSTTPRPTNLSFDDMALERLPANTGWGRLEGELVIGKTASGPLYELHDPNDPDRYVIVLTTAPLVAGHQMVTGHVSPRRATAGNVGTIAADVPAVPPVDEPIWLYLSPAVFAILLVVGLRTGYPVIRRDRATPGAGEPLDAGETMAATWSGRIGRDQIARDRGEPCEVALATVPDLPDMGDLRILTDGAQRSIRIRRAAPVRRIRLCRVGRTERAVEIHAATADLIVAFAYGPSRDRLAASLR